MTASPPTVDSRTSALIAEIDAVLISRGLPPGRASKPVIEGNWLQVELIGAKTTWTVKVELEAGSFAALPRIELISPLRLLAHVSNNQTICIDDGQGLSIDTSRPVSVIAHVVSDALTVLDDSDSDVELLGLFDEIEGYWEGLADSQTARAAVEVKGGSRVICGHVKNLGKGKLACWYLTEHTGGTVPSEFHTEDLASSTALYLELPVTVTPPSPGTGLDTAYIERVIDALTPEDRNLWHGTLVKRWRGQRRICPVLISMPRPSGGRSLIGLTFTLKDGKVDSKNIIRPLVIRRHTVGFMRERGGASNRLANKHVAIIGCGSVGSEIADTLAACGVGRLTLVDIDELDVENVFRHSLGKHAVGQDKPTALKQDLLRKYPGLEVTAALMYGHNWLDLDVAKLADAVVVATGAPAADKAMAKQIQLKKLQCITTFTWLEAFGLGGHVITSVPETGGCLNCVYRDDDGADSLYPYVSFLAPGQKVSQSISGCLGTHIPYSALHSRKTALLAANSVIEHLEGERFSEYLYWTGDNTYAKEHGIRTSPWYERSKTIDQKLASNIVFDGSCRHCGNTSA